MRHKVCVAGNDAMHRRDVRKAAILASLVKDNWEKYVPPSAPKNWANLTMGCIDRYVRLGTPMSRTEMEIVGYDLKRFAKEVYDTIYLYQFPARELIHSAVYAAHVIVNATNGISDTNDATHSYCNGQIDRPGVPFITLADEFSKMVDDAWRKEGFI